MTDGVFVGVVVAVVGALLTFVGALMIRSNNNLKSEVTAAKLELTALVTQVAVMSANHTHHGDRIALVESAVKSAHKRADGHDTRLVLLEAWRDAGNPENRRPE